MYTPGFAPARGAGSRAVTYWGYGMLLFGMFAVISTLGVVWIEIEQRQAAPANCSQCGEIARYAPLTYNPTGQRSPARLRVDTNIRRRKT